jgi:hypothetical protein
MVNFGAAGSEKLIGSEVADILLLMVLCRKGKRNNIPRIAWK